MRRMHFTHGQTAGMISTTGVQVLAIDIATHANGTGWHLPICTGQPHVVAATERLVVLQLNLFPRIGHVRLALVGNYLGRQQVIVVEGTTHKDGIAIAIVTGDNSFLWDGAVAVVQPSVSCKGLIDQVSDLRKWEPSKMVMTATTAYRNRPLSLALKS